eukprot:TRINITY_DN46479_c0_g1_i1.p1 TRINITY_DN46479_c0_g1~~TRINITY_DN46479_c0_g1_i1.p1  ORF type:complete len:122 (+),score=4.51 TRINITY_DN46479_c0_g1_i1:46-366(+)
MLRSLVGSEMCIRDRLGAGKARQFSSNDSSTVSSCWRSRASNSELVLLSIEFGIPDCGPLPLLFRGGGAGRADGEGSGEEEGGAFASTPRSPEGLPKLVSLSLIHI